MTDGIDVERLRQQVRSDRHATSYPLIVIGAVGFHYASFQFSGWVPVAYGLPLSFVALAVLQWRTEQQRGVGAGRDDVMAIAFAVFLLTSLAMSQTWRALMPWQPGNAAGVGVAAFWLFAPTAAGLAAIGIKQRNPVLVGWAVAIAMACLLGDLLSDSFLSPRWNRDSAAEYQLVIPQIGFAAATATGLWRFRAESAAQTA